MALKNNELLNGVPGTVVQLKGDYCLLSDWKCQEVMEHMNAPLNYDPRKVIAVIDHESPSGSIAVAEQQKLLIDFADENNLFLTHNGGVGYQAMMDHFAKEGDVVLCCGKRSAVMGAAGILAVYVTPEEMAGVLCGGQISRAVPEKVGIRFAGRLPENVSFKDVILSLISEKGVN